MTPSEETPTKTVDLYRDTWVRFLGMYPRVRYIWLTKKICPPVVNDGNMHTNNAFDRETHLAFACSISVASFSAVKGL